MITLNKSETDAILAFLRPLSLGNLLDTDKRIISVVQKIIESKQPPPMWAAEVVRQIKAAKFIQAIKELRAETSMDLREAKEMVENLWLHMYETGATHEIPRISQYNQTPTDLLHIYDTLKSAV